MICKKYALAALVLIVIASSGIAADWPMWRYDAGRTAYGPEELPQRLYPLWTLDYPAREPAWENPLNRDLMPFDRVFEPIVLGKSLIMGFNDCDKVAAFDTETGEQRWVFYADGPVRLPAAGSRDRVYFTSDDGHLYCLSLQNGELLWKFRGGPGERRILGNSRLISTWPARGGVVLKDGTIYFAASIWPFMGTFIYALDAETGEVVWRNEGTGAQYIQQPHNSPSFAGVAPQGAFVISGDRLLIPGGRSVPACFDRFSGEFLYYHLSKYNKTGGAFVCADEEYFFNHFRDRDTNLFDARTGEIVERRIGRWPVISDGTYYMSGDSIRVIDAKRPARIRSVVKVDATGDLIRSGSRLYAGGDNQITAVDISRDGSLEVAWREKVDGVVGRLLAADGKLFAVTLDGKVMAFSGHVAPVRRWRSKDRAERSPQEEGVLARRILDQTGIRDGYALVYGIKDGGLLSALALESDLSIVAVDPDAGKIEKLRRRFDEMEFLGQRIHLLAGTPGVFEAPPYMASLMVISKPEPEPDTLGRMIEAVRPYGGRIWLPVEKKQQALLTAAVEALNDPMLMIKSTPNSIIVSREGPLPGAANWTHQYGDIANTVKSDDKVVKLPLGILWFGGSSHVDVLPRHGHGPPEQIVDGRLIIEGIGRISARDVYTGRPLWSAKLDSVDTFGLYYDETYENTPLVTTYNQVHIPGANARGTNFVAASDRVYVVQGNRCRALDITDGRTAEVYTLADMEFSEEIDWGYLGVAGDRLIAGCGFVPFASAFPRSAYDPEQLKQMSGKDRNRQKIFENYDYTASRALAVLNRHDGTVKWKIDARYGFIHNAVIASERHLFCLDKLPPALEKRMARRGLSAPTDYRLLALDLETGRIVWERNSGIFGSWLGYSQETGLLLQATRPSRDMVRDETGERLAVYKAADGALLWDREIRYGNPPILHHDLIITDNAAYSLENGDMKQRRDPLTGEKIPWSYSRGYGCNYNIASEHLLSFRSAAAGFYDLRCEGGTGNFGGFKSGCTSNLIAANGVLNAPDYTRTCQCSYQNQTSLALIHMPELEYWTSNDFFWNGKPIEKVGLNLNAPGDRIDEDGVLWLDFPSQGGRSPDLLVSYDSLSTRGIRRHSLQMKGGDLDWVAASGLAGPLDIEITVTGEPMESAVYTVRLVFAELEEAKQGERLFDVWLQDQRVLRGFDIAAEAGGPARTVIRTFEGIAVRDKLRIRCTPQSEAKEEPLLCGIELRSGSIEFQGAQ